MAIEELLVDSDDCEDVEVVVQWSACMIRTSLQKQRKLTKYMLRVRMWNKAASLRIRSGSPTEDARTEALQGKEAEGEWGI